MRASRKGWRKVWRRCGFSAWAVFYHKTRREKRERFVEVCLKSSG